MSHRDVNNSPPLLAAAKAVQDGPLFDGHTGKAVLEYFEIADDEWWSVIEGVFRAADYTLDANQDVLREEGVNVQAIDRLNVFSFAFAIGVEYGKHLVRGRSQG